MKKLILRNWLFILLWIATGALSHSIFRHLLAVDYYIIPHIIGFITLAMTQWLLLRFYWGKNYWWGFATIVGVILSLSAPYIPLYNIVGVNYGLLPPTTSSLQLLTDFFVKAGMRGMIVSIPQWLVMRRHISKSAWWILANTIAWGLTAATWIKLPGVFPFLHSLILSIPYGVVTGIAMAWLHDRSPDG